MARRRTGRSWVRARFERERADAMRAMDNARAVNETRAGVSSSVVARRSVSRRAQTTRERVGRRWDEIATARGGATRRI